MSDKRVEKKEWFKTITYVVIFIVFLVAGGNYFLPFGGVGVFLWMSLTVIGLFFLISWHAKKSVQCLECGNYYIISFFKDFLTFHGAGRRGLIYLRCPMCREKNRVKDGSK